MVCVIFNTADSVYVIRLHELHSNEPVACQKFVALKTFNIALGGMGISGRRYKRSERRVGTEVGTISIDNNPPVFFTNGQITGHAVNLAGREHSAPGKAESGTL